MSLNSCVFCGAVGGGEDLRRYWSDYLRKTHVLVYVVDSSDRKRFPLAKAELHRLLSVDRQLPVVVLGNKQVNQMFELFLNDHTCVQSKMQPIINNFAISLMLICQTNTDVIFTSCFLVCFSPVEFPHCFMTSSCCNLFFWFPDWQTGATYY